MTKGALRQIVLVSLLIVPNSAILPSGTAFRKGRTLATSHSPISNASASVSVIPSSANNFLSFSSWSARIITFQNAGAQVETEGGKTRRFRQILPPWWAAEYESDHSLIAEIRQFIHRYVDISPLFEQIASYYILLSWVYDAFNELPYLRLRGDTGTGKTRLLLTAGSLCYKPIFASGASTVSPLFRILDGIHGTLIIDEGDFRFSDEKAEIVKIRNNGNARGFPVLRSESVNSREFSPRAYTVFGPKLVSTRGFFQDRAPESRCLTEETGGRRLRDDIPLNLTDEYRREGLTLRNKLLMFRIRNFGRRAIDATLVDRSIEPRLSQIFAPLLSVIDDAEARQALREVAREYHRELVADRGMDMEAQVLEIIQELRDSPYADGLSIKEIAERMADRYGDDFERKMTPHWIGYVVRRKLGLKTYRRGGIYYIAESENAKLDRLFEHYGIAVVGEAVADNAQEPRQDGSGPPPQ